MIQFYPWSLDPDDIVTTGYLSIKSWPLFSLQPRFDGKMDFSSLSIFIAFVSLKYAAFYLSMSDCFHQKNAAKYAETENRMQVSLMYVFTCICVYSYKATWRL